MRAIERETRVIDSKIEAVKANIQALNFAPGNTAVDQKFFTQQISQLETAKSKLEASIPANWEELRKQYTDYNAAITKAQREYFRTTDGAYEQFAEIRDRIQSSNALQAVVAEVTALEIVIENQPKEQAMQAIKQVESLLGEIAGTSAIKSFAGTSAIKSSLAKARRTLKKDDSAEGRAAALQRFNKAKTTLAADIKWRGEAADKLLPDLLAYDQAIAGNFGIRKQEQLTDAQARDIAACLSHHRDISLHF